MRLLCYMSGILLLIGLSGCSKEVADGPEGFIDPDLRPYVDRFVMEGAYRNVEVRTDGLTALFDGAGQTEFCGQGSVDSTVAPLVTISPDCWNGMNEWEREILLFHELGHALLNRYHLNRSLPACSIRSMMSDHPDVYRIYNQYTRFKRDYYLDELFFGKDTPTPYWGEIKPASETYFSDDIAENTPRFRWQFQTDHDDPHVAWEGVITTQEAASPGASLQIRHYKKEPGRRSSWSLQITDPDISLGDQLALRVKIRLENVEGNGVFLIMRGENDRDADPVFIVSSVNDPPINGDHDFREYSLDCMDYFPDGVDRLLIELGMDGDTRGRVFFDDIRLLRRF